MILIKTGPFFGNLSANGDDYSSGEYHRHLHDIEESRDSNTYFQFDGDLTLEQRSRYSYTPGETLEPIPDLVDVPSSTEDNSIIVTSSSQYNHQGYQHQNSGHKPPPYRGPPPKDLVLGHHHHQSGEESIFPVNLSDPQHQGVPDSPISPISFDSLQIHSSKFPVSIISSRP
jgi:hypothetical protein